MSGVCPKDDHEDSQSVSTVVQDVKSQLDAFDACPSPKDIMCNSKIKNRWANRKSLFVSSNELTKLQARGKKWNKGVIFEVFTRPQYSMKDA